MVARFREAGGLSVFDERWANGTRKVGLAQRRGICRVLAQRPPHFGYARPSWTLELLARVIEQELGIRLSVGHLWKVLKALKVRWGMTRPVVRCPRGRRRGGSGASHANVTRNHGCRALRELIAAVLRWLEVRFSDAQEYAHAA